MSRFPLSLALIFLGLPFAPLAEAEQAKRPNFLVLVADDLTYLALGAYGNSDVKTPNIDRLASRGTMFTQTYIQGGLGGAVCVTSRAMLATGRGIWNCGNQGNCSPDGGKTFYPLWGETLGKAGYQTFAVGKWHNGPKALATSFQSRTHTILGGMLDSTPTKGAAYHRPAPGNDWTADDPKWAGHWMKKDGSIVHSSERWADAAIAHLGEASKSADPFFLYVAFHAPHDPRQAPKAYLDKYPPEKLTLPPNLLPKHPIDLGEYNLRDEILAPYPRTEAVVRKHLQEYYAIITHLDDQIGRIIDALDKSGRGNDTVVIFTADNGLAVGRHGLFGKQSMYDHSIRVPLIYRGPGIPQGVKRTEPVYHHGLFPTTCRLAGIPVPSTVQAESHLRAISGEAPAAASPIISGYINKQRMIRDGNWKLIETPVANRVQLFDLAIDPDEMKDLSTDPAQRDRIKRLHDQLKKLCREAGDPLPSAKLDETLAQAIK